MGPLTKDDTVRLEAIIAIRKKTQLITEEIIQLEMQLYRHRRHASSANVAYSSAGFFSGFYDLFYSNQQKEREDTAIPIEESKKLFSVQELNSTPKGLQINTTTSKKNL